MLAIEAGGDRVIEGEGVPGEAPPGRSEEVTRSKVLRRSAQLGKCRSARNGQ
jgi:hypothetical protein